MTRFVSGEAEMEENPILKASLSMASDIPLYAQLTGIIKNVITSGTLGSPVGPPGASRDRSARTFKTHRF